MDLENTYNPYKDKTYSRSDNYIKALSIYTSGEPAAHSKFEVWQMNLCKWIGPFYSYRQAVSYCNSTNGTKLKETDDEQS